MSAPGDSWRRVNPKPYLDGTYHPPHPRLLRRDDGQGLLYPGEVHWLVGESGAGKGWILNHAAGQVLNSGKAVAFLDFEDGPASVIARLAATGVAPDVIADRFGYVRPLEPVDTEVAAANLDATIAELTPSLVIIDGVTEAMSLHGLNPSANDDAARFLAHLARPLAADGAAVFATDHMPKGPSQKVQFALGAQHKRAGTAVTYMVTTKQPIEMGRSDGLVQLWLAKDRHGTVQAASLGHTMPKRVADFRVAANLDGSNVAARLTAPQPPGPFRPTTLMERISRHLEQAPGATWGQIRADVTGSNDAKQTAIAVLIDEGHIRMEKDGQAHRHYSVNPYRAEDDPASDTFNNTGVTE